MKKKIFSAFEDVGMEPLSDDSRPEKTEIFYFKDPFDFYRIADETDMYIPKTQKGLRKAFSEGLIGIEFFIQMATSVRPLMDEAQDIDEITRLFSQQKLSQNPTPHSVRILRNMIKDPNPEIALYAAEGLNVIENSFIKRIQRLKDKLTAETKNSFPLNYSLGITYLRFSRFLDWQPLIQKFYLREALSYLIRAYYSDKSHYRTMMAVGEVFIRIDRYSTALKIFKQVLSFRENDFDCLMKIAECYFFLGLYEKLYDTFSTIIANTPHIDKTSEVIIYQWMI